MVEFIKLIICHIIFNGNNFFKNVVALFQYGNRHAPVDECAAFFVEIEDDLHHLKLFFHRYAGVFCVEGVLLEEAQTDDSGNFQCQFLVIRKNVASNQLDDLHQGALLIQDCHELISVCYKFRGNMLSVPWSQVFQIFTVAGEPVNSREVTGIGKGFVQSPEAADETFGVLCDRL